MRGWVRLATVGKQPRALTWQRPSEAAVNHDELPGEATGVVRVAHELRQAKFTVDTPPLAPRGDERLMGTIYELHFGHV